jgi:hypothetical protein
MTCETRPTLTGLNMSDACEVLAVLGAIDPVFRSSLMAKLSER